MSYFSGFLSSIFSVWPDDVTDPLFSSLSQQLVAPSQYNILYHRMEQFSLDDTDTRSITFANFASSEWVLIVMRVVGTAYMSIVGVDTNGSTPITSKIPAYGTTILPGIALISTYNASTFTVVSEEDDTQIEIYAAIACADSDTRLL